MSSSRRRGNRVPAAAISAVGAAFFGFSETAPKAEAGLTINAIYEPSWTANAPPAATADVKAIVNEIDALFTNNVTLNIQFGWGDYGADATHPTGIALPANAGGVAWFPQLYTATPDQYTLAQTETLLKNHATAHQENTAINTAVGNLPAAYPNPNGRATFFVSDAEYKALTGVAQNKDAVDGYVGFDTTTNWQYGATAGGATTLFFRGALEHEITHAMGRFDSAYYNLTGAGNPAYLTPLDFYKYTGKNLDPTDTVTKFSIDGGNTNPGGLTFDNTSDTSDWAASSADSFNYSLSSYQTMSPTDITELQALGYDPVPEPGSLAASACGLLLLARRHRRVAAVRI
jgi:hypothetical protein